ncbi:dihydrodipicolinate synthase family protein [Amaricoccus sp.]|uniref:dihydrodipicolinate synthase family protein n=1 Tax=Amaricoccus sp. TaxID=1872485 RepID=UPI00260939A3|nr:dihydrodipicolinate synthase family protein [Amaricoccus sp.]HRO11821.1 dihydrodipicolinate synthase family protein [Amaricoccus sp.]
MTPRPYSGIWPVAPTPFTEEGALDPEGMRRVIDCMIDQGVDGICILANFSEQFLLSDEERRVLTRLCLEHAAGRVPVIVTISHFATAVAAARAREAAELGAAMVMMMAPYHGALLRADEEGTFEHFARVGEAGGLPIMVQDAPISGVALPVPFLARMAREIEQVRLFKIETPQAAAKIRALIEAGGAAIEGPFDGEEAITLLADLDAGATGSMTSATLPDLIGPAIAAYLAGRRDEAKAIYARLLPLINFENRQCGWRSCKVVMKEGGVIRSDAVRHPTRPLHPETRAQLLELAREVEPLALRWGL